MGERLTSVFFMVSIMMPWIDRHDQLVPVQVEVVLRLIFTLIDSRHCRTDPETLIFIMKGVRPLHGFVVDKKTGGFGGTQA